MTSYANRLTFAQRVRNVELGKAAVHFSNTEQAAKATQQLSSAMSQLKRSQRECAELEKRAAAREKALQVKARRAAEAAAADGRRAADGRLAAQRAGLARELATKDGELRKPVFIILHHP